MGTPSRCTPLLLFLFASNACACILHGTVMSKSIFAAGQGAAEQAADAGGGGRELAQDAGSAAVGPAAAAWRGQCEPLQRRRSR